MDLAFKSYVAHYDHIPSPFAFVKHFNRFRTGLMPNKKGQTLKQIQEKRAIQDGSFDWRWKKMNKTSLQGNCFLKKMLGMSLNIQIDRNN